MISPEGVASFQAQRAQSLTGLTVRIDPIQEGTGDPSPSNIRPHQRTDRADRNKGGEESAEVTIRRRHKDTERYYVHGEC